MSRKDYEAIASIFRNRHDEIVETFYVRNTKHYLHLKGELELVAQRMAWTFAEGNVKFDTKRFMDACFDFSRTHELADQLV